MTHDIDVRADVGRAPILADLIFWTVVGAALVGLSGSLDSSWGVDRAVLVVIAGVLLVGGVIAVPVLWRTRPMPRRLVRVFGVANLALTPLFLLAAVLDWLSLTGPGNTALAIAAAVTLVLGGWQLSRASR